MKSELKIIDTAVGVTDLIQYLVSFQLVAYDVETTGLDKGSRIIGISICAEDSTAFYIIFNNSTTLYIPRLLKLLESKALIMHNAVFDCSMTYDNYRVNLIRSLHADTMIMAHLSNENRRIGLKELAKEYFGEDSTTEQVEMKASVIANGGIWTAKNKELYKADPYILGKYGAKDALLTYRLFWILDEEIYKQDLADFFYLDESMPLLTGPTYQLNTVGLRVDSNALMQLKKTLEAECLEAKEYIHAEIAKHIPDKFNIGSSQQLSNLLFGVLGKEFSTLTDAGRTVCKALGLKLPYTAQAKREFIATCKRCEGNVYQPEAIVNGKVKKAKTVQTPWKYTACDKKTLTKLAPKLKWVEKLLEYQRKTKILTTYVKGIEQRIQYGIIRPSFLQSGTTSGRYSSRNPNFQNLPRDDKRVKACIIPRPGKIFVGADYSQLEPRVFAYLSEDEKLLNSFKNGEDFYSVVGREVYDKLECTPMKDGSPDAFGVMYPKLRQDSKTFTLASTYGATGNQLSPLMNKRPDEAQEDINSYFEKFPSVKKMMLDSHEMAKSTGQVYNIFGRPRRMPDAMKIPKMYKNTTHSDLPYEARNMLNLAVNHRIQSTGASIINRAMISFCKACEDANIDAHIVAQVHDSLVVECGESDAKDVAALLEHCMINTTKLETVDLEAVPKIGKNLAEV